jgi:hypothetical protein
MGGEEGYETAISERTSEIGDDYFVCSAPANCL